MALFGQNEIDELKNRADAVEVIGAHVRLRRAGRNYIGLCPFHQEKTPSFTVSRERGFFHCFGCGAGGTVFNFLMRLEGLSFPEAVRSLAGRYGMTLHEGQSDPARASEREAMLAAAVVARDFFAHVLWKTEEGGVAREYLKSRGIGAETAREFALGFAPARPTNLAASLRKRDLLDAGLKIGLVKKDAAGELDMFRARLMFPILDTQGRPIAFGGRVLDQRLPKYMNSPESPLYSKSRNLYGLSQARAAIAKNDRAIVVEGYIDAIALSQAGFKETIASLGTALTADQLRLVGRVTRNVYACFDGDAAGRKASVRALGVFLEAGLVGHGIFIPSGFDPDTLVRGQGAAAFAALIDSAGLLVDDFLEAERVAAQGSLNGLAQAAQHVAEMLRLVLNAFEFDLLARRAAQALGVREELLRAEGRKRSGGYPTSRAKGQAQQPAATPRRVTTAADEAELGLLAIALAHPGLRETAARSLPLIEDRNLGELLIEACGAEGEAGELQSALYERLSETQRERFSALMVGPLMDESGAAEQLAAEYQSALERRHRLHEAEVSVRAASGSDAGAAVAALQRVIELRREEDKG